MKVDLNLLRVLLAVYETGNVTIAAAQLRMSQPTASAALARLRRSFGDPLFVRRDLRMEPTPFTESILQKTREVIEVIDREILSPATFDPLLFSGEINFCLSEIGEVVLLPMLYDCLRKLAPMAKIKTVSLAPKELDEALHEGEVNLAIGYFPDLTSADIFQQRLFSHDLVCMVRKDHRIKGRRMTLKDFSQAEHLLVRDGSRTLEMYEQYIFSQQIRRKIVLQMSHYMSVPRMIEQSDMVVVLPRTIAQLFAESWNVRVMASPVDIPRYDLKQYWHRRFQNEAKGRWLRTTVFDVFDGYMLNA